MPSPMDGPSATEKRATTGPAAHPEDAVAEPRPATNRLLPPPTSSTETTTTSVAPPRGLRASPRPCPLRSTSPANPVGGDPWPIRPPDPMSREEQDPRDTATEILPRHATSRSWADPMEAREDRSPSTPTHATDQPAPQLLQLPADSLELWSTKPGSHTEFLHTNCVLGGL